MEYLGHISTPTGLRPTLKHVSAIVDMPPPLGRDGKVNKTMLKSFIGMVKYSRRYIPKCGKVCNALNSQLRDDADGIWTQEHQAAMYKLKHRIAHTKG